MDAPRVIEEIEQTRNVERESEDARQVTAVQCKRPRFRRRPRFGRTTAAKKKHETSARRALHRKFERALSRHTAL